MRASHLISGSASCIESSCLNFSLTDVRWLMHNYSNGSNCLWNMLKGWGATALLWSWHDKHGQTKCVRRQSWGGQLWKRQEGGKMMEIILQKKFKPPFPHILDIYSYWYSQYCKLVNCHSSGYLPSGSVEAAVWGFLGCGWLCGCGWGGRDSTPHGASTKRQRAKC